MSNGKYFRTRNGADGLERRRGTRQERSLERRSRIAAATIEILASHGAAGLTHRLVAAKAGVSLAATTYYFDTKYDMTAQASVIVLRGYLESFSRAVERIRERREPGSFRQFVGRLVRNAARRDRLRTICWAEIILDAHRRKDSLGLARLWFIELDVVWRQIAQAARMVQPAPVARSAIDIVIGLLFMTVALGLNEEQVDAVLADGGDPLENWGTGKARRRAEVPVSRFTRKSAETRERILAATVDLLIAQGPGAVTYRNIAAKADLTPAAPFYHFPTVSTLLAAAEQRLFEESKQRYREAASADPGQRNYSLAQLVDRTATVFLREATQFAGRNLAAYAIWLEAARAAELRPMVWSAIADQHLAWQRVLSRVMPGQRPLDALTAQAGFIGKIVRVLATGSAMDDLASVRGEIAYDLTELSHGRFWL